MFWRECSDQRRTLRIYTSYGSDVLDASVLVISRYGFLPATDPRERSTVAAVEKDLLRDGLVLRYDTKHGTDGLPGSEGAFLACTFWLTITRLPAA
jgi:GH15 family glucan-1,4-alpha-glucosidase